ncbi:MAG: XRE family transcriptional regulator [Pseudomonadota bacterium]|nr:XRE family transcriptional regulator [Pseudomonadota bacterium]
MDDTLTTRLAERLKKLRQERGYSLDSLADLSGVSRATLSRLENAETSPTAEVLSKLCTAYAMTLTRLLSMVEEGYTPLLRRTAQPLWTDSARGFRRRAVSPPASDLAAEVIECTLDPGTEIDYAAPPVNGLEHHLVMQEGRLELTVDGQMHELGAGDCLRYRLFGASHFRTGGEGARYLLVLVGG